MNENKKKKIDLNEVKKAVLPRNKLKLSIASTTMMCNRNIKITKA